MTMSVGDRIHQKRIEKGYSLAKLGEMVGVSASGLMGWEKGTIENLKANMLYKLAEALNTTPGYLMGWEDEDPLNIPGIEPLPEMIHIPLLGEIACGEPIIAQENIEDYVAVDKELKADFALRCKGDSMILARIYDGDLVYIKKQPDVENGEIAAVLIDNEATLKRVYKFPGRVELRPENPRYETLTFAGPEDIRILGKAIIFVAPVK